MTLDSSGTQFGSRTKSPTLGILQFCLHVLCQRYTRLLNKKMALKATIYILEMQLLTYLGIMPASETMFLKIQHISLLKQKLKLN